MHIQRSPVATNAASVANAARVPHRLQWCTTSFAPLCDRYTTLGYETRKPVNLNVGRLVHVGTVHVRGYIVVVRFIHRAQPTRARCRA